MLGGLSSKNNEMPIPTRSAPRPPGMLSFNQNQRNIDWIHNSDPFGPIEIPQVQKKKAPPRPPPPRFHKKDIFNDGKLKKPAKPTEILTSIFGKKTSKQQQGHRVNVAYSGNDNRPSTTNLQSNNLIDGTVSLIDLSPPSSPTFNTRSSSDGVSIDSFGSDGNSNPSAFTNSSGNTSQTESAFEDDFDFFSNATKENTLNDPWKPKDNGWSINPFESNSTNGRSEEQGEKRVGEARFFTHNSDTPKAQTMPTIIRVRPPKPPAPKILPTNLAPKITNFRSDSDTWMTFKEVSEILHKQRHSPPMPLIPPPAPPCLLLQKSEFIPTDKNQPHGIALYDFPASQAGDLPLKQGDTVIIKKYINDEWLEGQIGNKSGMFPANFIDVIVPLQNVNVNECIVNALYSFKGETWEDLTFEEGAKITVLSRISDDWLYGAYQGMKGQFPANYVDRAPKNLPQFSSSQL